MDPYARRAYYSFMFPFQSVFNVVSKPGGSMGLVSDDGTWDRSKTAASADEIRKLVLAQNPREVHVGAKCGPPGSVSSKSAGIWRPLVFDVDLPDFKFSVGSRNNPERFQTLRTPEKGPTNADFRKSWVFIQIAVKIIDKVLDVDFGFKERRWIASGNKGVHCWVFDERACCLDWQGRAVIYNYISSLWELLDCSYDGLSVNQIQKRKEDIVQRSPHLLFCYSVIREKMDTLLNDQQLYDTAIDQIVIPGLTGSDDRTLALLRWRGEPWAAFEKESRIRAVQFALQVAMPRLDMNQMNPMHLCKVPFSVHKETGMIAVPFPASMVDLFDPALVPTVQDALDFYEDKQKGRPPKKGKDFDAYVHFFQEGKCPQMPPSTSAKPGKSAAAPKRPAPSPPGGAPPPKRTKPLRNSKVPKGLAGLFKA